MVNRILHEKFALANSQDTPQFVLCLLSVDEEEIIRGAVALNHSTPPHVLNRLSNDPSEYVREAIYSRKIIRLHLVLN